MAAVVGDWTDFAIIAALLVLNASIGYIEEAKAESAVEALKATLALKSRVIRPVREEEEEEEELMGTASL